MENGLFQHEFYLSCLYIQELYSNAYIILKKIKIVHEFMCCAFSFPTRKVHVLFSKICLVQYVIITTFAKE